MNVSGLQKPTPGAASASNACATGSGISQAVEFVDRLRDLVIDHLGRIETLVKLAGMERSADSSELEESLKERIIVLETAQTRLMAAAARREVEWREFVDDLELDRKRLAEAWDRLEVEQLKSVPVSSTETILRPHQAHADSITTARNVDSESTARPDAISAEILRQFRSLQGDVRRNTK